MNVEPDAVTERMTETSMIARAFNEIPRGGIGRCTIRPGTYGVNSRLLRGKYRFVKATHLGIRPTDDDRARHI